MTSNEKFNSILSTILQLPMDQVTDNLTAETVDTWDSLNHINLIGALEQEFEITLPTADMDRTMSVASLKMLLAEHGIRIES